MIKKVNVEFFLLRNNLIRVRKIRINRFFYHFVKSEQNLIKTDSFRKTTTSKPHLILLNRSLAL